METLLINLITGQEIENATQAQNEGATHVVQVFDKPNESQLIFDTYRGIKSYCKSIKGKYKHLKAQTVKSYIKNQYS